MSNKRRNTQADWTPKFLAAFAEHMTIKSACKDVGINRTTFYRRKQADEEFALAFHDLEEEITETLEREAHRRAAEGTLKPIYYQGQAVGAVKEFSDSLLMFLLKARRPEKYRDNVRVEHAGKVEHEHGGALDDPEVAEALRLVRDRLAAAREQ